MKLFSSLFKHKAPQETTPKFIQKEGECKLVGTQILGKTSFSINELFWNYPISYSNKYKESVWKKAKEIHGHTVLNSGLDVDIMRVCLDHCESYCANLATPTQMSKVPCYFDYEESDENTKRWYLNFADPTLFVACSSSLFAQDEIQTLEHPLLCIIRPFLAMNHFPGLEVYTHTEGRSTPYLFTNIPYLIDVNTKPELPDGRIVSIYGNAFSYYEHKDPSVLDMAIKVRKKVSYSNIIAMAAPRPSYGNYEKDTIIEMLSTTISAFEGAKHMSEDKTVEIHTGRWGAGAFGGNEELALIVQMIGAMIAEIEKIVFHAVNDACYENAVNEVNNIIQLYKQDEIEFVENIAEYLYKKKYQWGVSDGN